MSTPSEEDLTVRQVRPRFKVESPLSIGQLTDQINIALKNQSDCIGYVKAGQGKIQIPVEDQHYWSPQLTLTLEECESGTSIRGLYGPRPAVWTLFVFFYSLIAFAALIISIVGMSFLTLGKPAGILWVVPVLLVVYLSLYLVAYSGKRLGYDQMVRLHKFIEKSTGLDIEG